MRELFIFHRFEALVEREWLQAGHPFQDRCVKSAFAVTKQRKEAPVFLLFLDCVWQVNETRISFLSSLLSLSCLCFQFQNLYLLISLILIHLKIMIRFHYE